MKITSLSSIVAALLYASTIDGQGLDGRGQRVETGWESV